MTTTLIIPDCHVPFHDRKAWNLVLTAARELDPDRVVILGDFLDCYAVSTFPKSPDRAHHLKDEVRAGAECLEQLHDLLSTPHVAFLEGNHEHRISKYVGENAPALYGMVSLRQELKIDEYRWKWVPYRSHLTVGKLAYAHEIGHAGKGAVQQSLDSFGSNIVIGHTHRAGITYGGTVRGEHRVAMSCGWLGDFGAIDYMHKSKTRDWQHGVGVAHQDSRGNGWVSFCPIINGRINIDGSWIGSNTK